MTKRLSSVSILFSFSTIIATLIINHAIAHVWLTTDGKTRALFGLVLISYSYKYYYLVLGVAALVNAIIAIRMREGVFISYVALLISLIAIVIVFLDIWKLMI